MDASNAFNSLNRETALWNARILWPRCSRFLFNTYRGFASLFVAGADEYSREGTTQGDPLAMFFYGVSLLPLIRKLKDPNNALQSWYADDSAAIAKLKKLEIWLKNLIEEDPAFGYFPEPSKSFLIVDKQYAEEAHHIFDKYSITIVEGKRFLGGFIGDGNEKDIYLKKKELECVDKIEKLSFVAKTEPQCALSRLTKSLQAEWNFSHRVLGGSSQLFQPLENLLMKKFLPAILATSSISSCLPARKGGLGVSNPTSFADEFHNTSREAVTVLYEAIVDQHGFSHEDHRKQISRSRKKHHRIMEEKHDELLELLNELPADQVRAVKRIDEGSLTAWLTVLPIAAENFDLSEVEFRDALNVRYNKNLNASPTFCDGCQSPFTLRHALACKKGGLLTLRHNEIRDAVGDLAALVWKDVQREPVIREYNPQDETPALIADLFYRGVYVRQGGASFDIRVSDTDAISYQNRSPMSVLHSEEVKKKTKYSDACQERHMSFTPLVVSVDGMLAPEFANFLRRIG